MAALHTVFIFSACLCAIAAVVSFLRGRHAVAGRTSSLAAEPPAAARDRKQARDRTLKTLAD